MPAAYIAGCDGAHSKVREQLKIGFPGGTYEHLFYVADVAATGSLMNGELHVGLDKSDFLALFPLKDAGRVRLVGAVSDQALTQRKTLTWDDVNTRVMQWMPIKVARVNWFSTYHVHHRAAKQFRKGRAFLLGDAAHIHSPVGGQGIIQASVTRSILPGNWHGYFRAGPLHLFLTAMSPSASPLPKDSSKPPIRRSRP